MAFSRLVCCATVLWLVPERLTAAEQITNSIGMKLVLIPAGEFQMGAEEDPSDTLNAFPYASRKWLERETPRPRVRVTQPFYMGESEATLKELVKLSHKAKHPLDAMAARAASLGDHNGNLVESPRYHPTR